MRHLIFVAAAFTAIGTFPAAAAGCGMMGQAAATGSTEAAPAASAMMCGGSPAAAPQSTPTEQGQSAPAAGGCPCCAKMASMKMPETKGGQSMPGMDMPAVPPAAGQ